MFDLPFIRKMHRLCAAEWSRAMSEQMNKNTIPSPEEIRREFENFAREKFGGNVQFFAHPIGATTPPPQAKDSIEPQLETPKPQLAWKFDLTPKQVKAHLDRFVIKQDEAKKALAIAVCDHYNHVRACHENPEISETNYAKQNVLMLGPTGVGKTYLVKQIAKLIGVPFVKADATRFTETGYVGANVDDLIRDLVSQAGGDVRLAQYGIIYLDEADKLATPPSVMGRDVSGRGVQFGLLKLMEETEVDLRSGNDIASQMQMLMDFQSKGKVEKKLVNTRHILFIASGAFNGLNEIIRKRLQQKSIGISADPKTRDEAHDNFQLATTQDFVDFGFEPEFIGRLPVRVGCEWLKAEDLLNILKNSEESICKQYERAFAAYGIKLKFDDQALEEISLRASHEKTGARALMTVCEKILRDFKFELPSTDITELVVDGELVQSPQTALDKLLKSAGSNRFALLRADLRRFERNFFSKHGLEISFDGEATAEICRQADGHSIEDVASRLLLSYEHGLNLVKQNTGQVRFEFGKEIVIDPKLHLEKLIRESYSRKH